MSRFAVILPAAGQSSRFQKQRRKKVFVELAGRAVWLRAADCFVNRPDVAQVLVVVSPDDLEWFKEKFAPNMAFMNVEIVAGGKERADSVGNALARVKSDVEYVAVHDAARPLVSELWIDQVFARAQEVGAAILATPITSTIKRATPEGLIETTVSRERMWAAQTPQVFRRDWLLDAYARRGGLSATDEAQLVEQAGYPIALVECPVLNLKITTESDYQLAEVALPAVPKAKGLSALHPFANDDPNLWR